MGIDIWFEKRVGDGYVEDEEEGDHVASVPEFFDLALALGAMRALLGKISDPMVTEPLRVFLEYTKVNRDANLINFREYAQFVNASMAGMLKIYPDNEQIKSWTPVSESEFDEDIRAFLGGFFLRDEPIGPEECAIVAPFIQTTLVMMRVVGNQCVDAGEPQWAGIYRRSYDCLEVVGQFCFKAVDENRMVRISA